MKPYYAENSKPELKCHPDAEGKLFVQPEEIDVVDEEPFRRVSHPAGRFGAPGAGCDSPLALINETLRFVAERLNGQPEGMWRRSMGGSLGSMEVEQYEAEKEKGLDFVIWTGDSARHDNDPRYVRTEADIQALNHLAVTYMLRTFPSPESTSRSSIPIIPTIGNNDIWPHNSMTYTPNLPNPTLDYYAALWAPFMSKDQTSSFSKHGSFSVEVIQDRLLVASINTMYLSNSNDLVRDCSGKAELDGNGGDAVLKFLEEDVLKGARERGIGVHIIGHVPPNPLNYWPHCYVRFANLMDEYKDVILGQHYGHMNVGELFRLPPLALLFVSHQLNHDLFTITDHFFFPTKTDGVGEGTDFTATLLNTRPNFSATNTPINALVPGWFSMYFHYLMTHYHAESRRDPSTLVQPVFVAPSVVPNMNPAVRTFTYNANTTSPSSTDTKTPYTSRFGALLNYKQYYSDIAKWNAIARAAPPGAQVPGRGEYIYEKEYRPVKAYKMPDGEGVGPVAWWDFAGRLNGKGGAGKGKVEKLREKYLRNMVVGVKGVKVGKGKKKVRS
ncbi:Endopolyphosphatase [Rhizophlyctis rosea]|nr:Endopolyphosphatase [Rhizophlyctis rosea]